MNLVFAATPEFAVPALEALTQAGHRVLAIYTQPDRPAGRGRKLTMSAIKEYALAHDLPVHQPSKLREAESELRALAPEAMIVIAYGQILPPAILAIPKHGCINVHASLLPRWRGAAPIVRALEAGDMITGVTIMRMDAGLDTGPMFVTAETPIHASDTAKTLHDRLAVLGARTLVSALERLARGELHSQPQPETGASYAPKLKKEEAALDWSQPARVLHCKIRAFNPYPIAVTTFRGKSLRLWDVGALDTGRESAPGVAPGIVLVADKTGVRVQTGDGSLVLTRLQAEGGKILASQDFVNGSRVQTGERLGI
jgi:methionyl-tRNA formyltransferase